VEPLHHPGGTGAVAPPLDPAAAPGAATDSVGYGADQVGHLTGRQQAGESGTRRPGVPGASPPATPPGGAPAGPIVPGTLRESASLTAPPA